MFVSCSFGLGFNDLETSTVKVLKVDMVNVVPHLFFRASRVVDSGELRIDESGGFVKHV